jgi:hypothetical protein
MIESNRLELIYALTNAEVKHGWLSKEKFYELAKVYDELSKLGKPLVAVETGTFYGFSAIAQGLLIRDTGLDCKLYAIDAWSKEASMEGTQSEANKEWWANVDYNEAYNSFMRSIYALGLEKIIVPIKGKSEDVIDRVPQVINFWHCDSNHVAEVITKEMELYAPRVDGWICLDDFFWAEANEAYEKGIDKYGLTKMMEYNKDGVSFCICKK